MTHRCFLAIRVPYTEKYLDTIKHLRNWGRISIVDPDLYHFTLHFFGNISSDQILRIKEVLDIQAKNFEITLKGTGFLPTNNPNNVRVLYIDVSQGLDDLNELYDVVKKKLRSIRFHIRRSFLPHLTVARVKKAKSPDIIVKNWLGSEFDELDFRVQEIVMIESILTPNGPIYKDLFSIPLL